MSVLRERPAVAIDPLAGGQDVVRRRSRRLPIGLIVAGIVLAALALAVAWPGLLSGTDPLRADPLNALRPPSAQHWFGTDQLGRDVYARVVFGARHSLAIGAAATFLAVAGGIVLGLGAGLANRYADGLISRTLDVLGAFPELLLALLVVAFTGPGSANVVFAIAVGSVARYARVMRAETLVVKGSGYVQQAVTLGWPRWRIVLRHVLPNALGPIPVLATIGLGSAVVAAASLSFLGLGPQPPSPEWGAMLSDGRNYLRVAWWGVFFPGGAVTLTVIALTVVGRHAQRRFEGRRA
jgi:peptide/nickel transport system permease protein